MDRRLPISSGQMSLRSDGGMPAQHKSRTRRDVADLADQLGSTSSFQTRALSRTRPSRSSFIFSDFFSRCWASSCSEDDRKRSRKPSLTGGGDGDDPFPSVVVDAARSGVTLGHAAAAAAALIEGAELLRLFGAAATGDGALRAILRSTRATNAGRHATHTKWPLKLEAQLAHLSWSHSQHSSITSGVRNDTCALQAPHTRGTPPAPFMEPPTRRRAQPRCAVCERR